MKPFWEWDLARAIFADRSKQDAFGTPRPVGRVSMAVIRSFISHMYRTVHAREYGHHGISGP